MLRLDLIHIKRWWYAGLIILIMGNLSSIYAQPYEGDAKWLRVNSLHTYFSEAGAQHEGGAPNLSWPAEYSFFQSTRRSEGIWMGCADFYDATIDKSFSAFVVNSGPKPTSFNKNVVFVPPAEFKLVGQADHPIVTVDGQFATNNVLYDVLDDIENSIPADRMLVLKNHTLMGVTITQRIHAFTQQYHNNYYIHEYVLTNTGIINPDGRINEQTLNDFWFCRLDRYSLMGESVPGAEYGEGWGIWNTSWGRNTVNDVVGRDPGSPDFDFRAHFAWYGLHSEYPVDSWGAPNHLEDGILAAAKFVGCVTLHADRSVDDGSDDPNQPRTTHYHDSDADFTTRANSIYDEPIMTKRYQAMQLGHDEKTQAEEVGDGFADEFGPGIGGSLIMQGYGPYTLEHGDSIRIVVGEAVAGLSRKKNREVGGNWLQWENGTGSPALILPDGSTATDHNKYKKAWVWTSKDSLFQTFRRAIQNFSADYSIPQPPPAPDQFKVTSGGDRIRLEWADNAMGAPHFDGYVIYRAEGNVLVPKAVYEKIFECDRSNVVHSFDDVTAVRGFDYYYYIQSKDDGTQNVLEPGKPLHSRFYTVTNVPAYLRRPAGQALEHVRVVPNPYDIRARKLAFEVGDSQYDRIAFYGLPPFCTVKVYTERGDLVWEKEHNDGSGDELWDSLTSSGQIVVSGIYILYIEVSEDTYADDSGEKLFAKGESVVRKFVIIR